MGGTAAAASSLLTVISTSSEPARASALTCATVESTSAVSVLVIDCTTTGAGPPTVTEPTRTGMDLRRGRVMVNIFYRDVLSTPSSIVGKGGGEGITCSSRRTLTLSSPTMGEG